MIFCKKISYYSLVIFWGSVQNDVLENVLMWEHKMQSYS
jgi:hypothetical protein